jgi:hypothetical protein
VAEAFNSGHDGLGTYGSVCDSFTSVDVQNACCQTEEAITGSGNNSTSASKDGPSLQKVLPIVGK